MSRICPNCGKKLPSGLASCPFCAGTAEEDVQIYTPRAAAAAPSASGAHRRAAAGILCAALLAGGGAALWMLSRARTPEKTAEAFRQALAAGDYEALRSVAAPAGDADFSADALAPMFTLYRESAAFRQQAAGLASTDAPCLHLEKKSGLPFSGYRVLVDTCDLEVVSNIAGANVTAGTASGETAPLGEDVSGESGALAPSQAQFDALFPGVYDVSVDYTSPLGQSFEASTTVNLMQPQKVDLDLDYTSLYVWNSSSIPVELTVDGVSYGQLAAGASAELAPLHEDALVTASCTTGAGETLTDSVTAASRSFEVLFSFGRVDVYNDYDANMNVQLNGADYCVIPGKTLQTISGISLGSTLSFSLADSEIFSPYDYQLVYDFDSICPILDLSEESRLAVSAVLQDALSSAPLTGEDDGLLSGLDQLLIENGWSRSDVVISDVSVDAVYAMQSLEVGALLRLSGSYACTNITLPDASSPQPPADGSEDADEEASGEDPAPYTQNPQYQNFYAAVIYDGESWSVAE